MGVGGIISVEDYIKMERDSLKKYIENTIERLLNAVEGIQIKWGAKKIELTRNRNVEKRN